MNGMVVLTCRTITNDVSAAMATVSFAKREEQKMMFNTKGELKMKRILFSVVVVLLAWISINAQAEFKVDLENRLIDAKGVTPIMNIFGASDLTKKIQFFGFSSTSKAYNEAYAGLIYMPFSWLQIAGGMGIENAESPWRIGAYIWTGKGPWNLLLAYEDGGSGYWYKALVTYNLKEWLNVGLHTKRFMGIGPYLCIKLPSYDSLFLYVVPAYDFKEERQKTIVALGLKY